jgi:DNA repair photolyase
MARMEAVAQLNAAGIPCGILVAPLMPGINDSPEQVERILTLAAEAGATGIGGIALHLRGEVKQIFMDFLREHRPELVPRYEELYRRGAYAPPAERRRLQQLVRRDELRGGTWPRDLRGVAKAKVRGAVTEPIGAGAAGTVRLTDARRRAAEERAAVAAERERERAAQQTLF